MAALVALLEANWRPEGRPSWVCFVLGALWPLYFVVFVAFFIHAMLQGDGD